MMIKLFRKLPEYRFVCKTYPNGEKHFYTERLEKYYMFSYMYCYVSGTLSLDYDQAKDNFDRLNRIIKEPTVIVLEESEALK